LYSCAQYQSLAGSVLNSAAVFDLVPKSPGFPLLDSGGSSRLPRPFARDSWHPFEGTGVNNTFALCMSLLDNPSGCDNR